MSVGDVHGQPAKTFGELWQHGTVAQQPDGTWCGSLQLDGVRVIDVGDRLIRIRGMKWTVGVDGRDITISGHAQGRPVFLLEQLGADGKPTMRRVITDTQLKLWEFDAKRVFRSARPDESWEWEPAVTTPPTP
jgi:hypothetical protein